MIIRYAFAITSGIFMTLTLFYAMQRLIAMDPFDPVEPLRRGTLLFRRIVVEDPVVPTEFTSYKTLREPIEPTPPRPGPFKDGKKFVVGQAAPPAPPPGPSMVMGNFMHDGPWLRWCGSSPPIRHAPRNRTWRVT